MSNQKRFSFLQDVGDRILPEPMPYLSLVLERQGRRRAIVGLLDTGSTVSVLPYRIGLDLGAIWEEQTIPLKLKGNLADFEARALLLMAEIEGFLPVSLAFAWTRSENVPVILGHTNFFMEFNVCFYRSQHAFDIQLKS